MRTIMSGCEGDEEGVETGELDRKEMKGKEDRCKKRKRKKTLEGQIEGRKAAETDKQSGRFGWRNMCSGETDTIALLS